MKSRWIRGAVMPLAATAVLATLAAVVLLLFGLNAAHGLDLTDEGFYLLNFRHWDATPAFTLFGAYFHFPYRLFGERLWAMRMLGFILLSVASGWCAYQTVRTGEQLAQRQRSPLVLPVSLTVALTAVNYYGGLIVPYTPSYNLLALVCALVSTALTMQVARALANGAGVPMIAAVSLGFGISIGIVNKFSAGALVAVLDGAIAVAIVWGRVPLRRFGNATVLALSGLLLNILLLYALDRDIIERVSDGIAIQIAQLPRDLVAEYTIFLSAQVPNGFANAARMLLWPLVFLGAVLVARRLLGWSGWLSSAAWATFVLLAMYMGFVRHRNFRIEFLSLVALVLLAASAAGQRAFKEHRLTPRICVLVSAIFMMPFAYSFGTNNAMLQHMAMAGVFPSILIATALGALRRSGVLGEWGLVASLVAVAAAPSEIFVRQWNEGQYNYRLGASLAEQRTELPDNPARVHSLVPRQLAESVGKFLRIIGDAGFRPGTAIFDLTGQSPGLVMLAGGRPVGATWIVGGGDFKGDDAARLAVSLTKSADLRAAWLLTSEDSFSQIRTWRQIVEQKIGSFPYEDVGRVTVPDPSSFDKKIQISVTIWRPVESEAANASTSAEKTPRP